MRRCTSCFRFQPGNPTYCAHCGRSFDVRICSRGHRNPRHVEFCSECGSADLSTPSPPASLGFRITGFIVYVFVIATALLVVLSAVLFFLDRVDGSVLVGPLAELILVVGFLYWTTTLLPGPVRKLGKAAGKHVIKSMRNRKEKGR